MITYIVVGALVLAIFTVWLATYNVVRRLYMSELDNELNEPNQDLSHEVPPDLLELHELLELKAATDAEEED